MKNYQIFLSGVIATITALWWPWISGAYISLVVALGAKSFFIFPVLFGILAWLVVFAYRGAKITLDVFIQKKIKNRRYKNFLLRSFKKSKLLALTIAAFLLTPITTPLLAKICFKKESDAYKAAIFLNITTTIIWIFIYFGAWEIIKKIFGI